MELGLLMEWLERNLKTRNNDQTFSIIKGKVDPSKIVGSKHYRKDQQDTFIDKS